MPRKISKRKAIQAAKRQAAAATIRRLSDALRFYRDQFCEGFCDECPATFTSPEMESDCSGCKARAVLAEIEKGTTL